jgi:hypothetical protein
MEKRIGRA